LLALSPQPALAAELGVELGAPVEDAELVIDAVPGWSHGALPLLCPGSVARPLKGGTPLATLQSRSGAVLGHGLISAQVGRGSAWLLGHDLAQTIAALRHGTGQLSELPGGLMGPLAGPRHLFGFFELSDKLPRRYPVADLHQDLVRLLIEQALAGLWLPRLWHFPAGAPALWFIKSDGCGEPGLETLVEVAEAVGAFVTYYCPPVSRYAGELLREFHRRGHGFSIEADINDLTQETVEVNGLRVRRGLPVDELNEQRLPQIRARLQAHRDAFEAATGLRADTVCIHSCQWTGKPMADMLLALDWHTPTHFASHDPRMRHDARYGPYMISTALPMRYYDAAGGVLDLWHMPAQWDESQTLGDYDRLVRRPAADWSGWQALPPAYHGFYDALAPDRAAGIVGLTPEGYGAELAYFASEAATRWHGVQICNFHPLYVGGPQDHPRASRRALEIGLEGARAAGCRFENLESWSRFFRARATVALLDHDVEPNGVTLTISAQQAISELYLILPDDVTQACQADTGVPLQLETRTLEGREQRGLSLELQAGRAVRLHLTGRPEH
jgi:hypothetical protein